MPPGGSAGIDRDVISNDSNTGGSSSSNQVFNQNKSLHKSCDPKAQFDVDEKMDCNHTSPIVLCLDVSGSMSEWPKIIYDKLPMFFGQIVEKGYLKDPALSFCAIDDIDYGCPVQVTEFGQGKQIDELISKIFLVNGGPGPESATEAYDLGFYFYSKKVDMSKAELPFFFIIGDEGFRKLTEKKYVSKYIGDEIDDNLKTVDIIHELQKKFNVFLLHKYYNGSSDKKIVSQWRDALGHENVIIMKTPKACVDVMLGIMAVISKSRTMKEYIKDMKDRGQTTERITEVTESLTDLNKAMDSKVIIKKE
eukprot:gene8148-12609_t